MRREWFFLTRKSKEVAKKRWYENGMPRQKTACILSVVCCGALCKLLSSAS
jgi:hypothetical protein